ncbi:hypothetical protein AA313_de0210156 [Arthrobotrys entomopaga]|nr:hypothetical protein AA313_de0210156 [Arthrobotrys entomopaga]
MRHVVKRFFRLSLFFFFFPCRRLKNQRDSFLKMPFVRPAADSHMRFAGCYGGRGKKKQMTKPSKARKETQRQSRLDSQALSDSRSKQVFVSNKVEQQGWEDPFLIAAGSNSSPSSPDRTDRTHRTDRGRHSVSHAGYQGFPFSPAF